jgi:hypothetical protein
VNQAQVLGVDRRFWKQAPGAAEELPLDGLALNARAASFTRVKRTSKCAASRGSLRLSLPLLIAAGSLPAPWNSN